MLVTGTSRLMICLVFLKNAVLIFIGFMIQMEHTAWDYHKTPKYSMKSSNTVTLQISLSSQNWSPFKEIFMCCLFFLFLLTGGLILSCPKEVKNLLRQRTCMGLEHKILPVNLEISFKGKSLNVLYYMYVNWFLRAPL